MKKNLKDLLCEYLGELKCDIDREFDWHKKELLLQKEDAGNVLLGIEPEEKRESWLGKVTKAIQNIK